MPVAMKNIRLHTVGTGTKADGQIDLDIDGPGAINIRKVFELAGNAPKDPAEKPDAPQPTGAKREIVTNVIGGLLTALVVAGAGLIWSWLL
jgi:hypothetical protein